jgi:hypothetical protein
MAGCDSCRLASKTIRQKVLPAEDGDGEMEMIAVSDSETESVFNCHHPSQPGRLIGIGEDAGKDCPLYEAGQKTSALPPHLQRLLDRWG